MNAATANVQRQRRKFAELNSLLSFMRSGGLTGNDATLKALAEHVETPGGGGEIRFIFETQHRPPVKDVLSLINNILVAYFIYLVRMPNKNNPYKRNYKASTIVEKFKKLLAVLHEQGILVHMSHLGGFPGSLNNISTVEFAKAEEADPNYNDSCKYELSLEENNAILRLLNSEEYDLEGTGLQPAIVYLSCLVLMLRGAGEIHGMQWTKVINGVYGPEHQFAGNEFISLAGFADKTHKQSLRTSSSCVILS